MSKKKQKKKKVYTQHELVLTYKPKRGRPVGDNPSVAWHVELDDKLIGTATKLVDVTRMMDEMGYKIWADRRRVTKKGRPQFYTTAIRLENDGGSE
jgi:hypothetical protein